MFKTTYTQKEIEWLHDNYYYMTHQELEQNFELMFGRFVQGKTLRRKCYNDGLRKQTHGMNDSHYKVGDGRKRRTGSKQSKETIFKIRCSKLGIVDALLKGHTPL